MFKLWDLSENTFPDLSFTIKILQQILKILSKKCCLPPWSMMYVWLYWIISCREWRTSNHVPKTDITLRPDDPSQANFRDMSSAQHETWESTFGPIFYKALQLLPHLHISSVDLLSCQTSDSLSQKIVWHSEYLGQISNLKPINVLTRFRLFREEVQ